MKSSMLLKPLLTIIIVAGCSSSKTGDVASTTTSATDKLSSLLSRVDDSVSMYIESSILHRPELLSRISQADLLACASATSKDIASLIYFNRTSQTPATISGTASEAWAEMVINEATAAVQSQIEPILVRCAQGS